MTLARACANIALVKYWGKRADSVDGGGLPAAGSAAEGRFGSIDPALNLPATGSLSLTLDALVTETRLELDGALTSDAVTLDGAPAGDRERAKVSAFLDLVRARSAPRARVDSVNRFPTASGLASSASGFAALAVAATAAYDVVMTPRALSQLARKGSGSAARSILGGFVRMHAGATDSDAFAEPIESPLTPAVRMVVAVVGGGAPKQHGSGDAMAHVAATSPLYDAWLALVTRDLATAEDALAAGDLARLGEVAEANALAMHASAFAARPAIVYWQPATVALLAIVRELRAAGHAAWATIDAGPHVKVLTTAADAAYVAKAVANIAGVTEVLTSGAGRGAEIVR